MEIAASKLPVRSGTLSASQPNILKVLVSESSSVRSINTVVIPGKANSKVWNVLVAVDGRAREQWDTSIRSDHTHGWIHTQVLAVAAANVRDQRAVVKRMQELGHKRPWMVARVAEMRRDRVVDLVDMLGL